MEALTAERMRQGTDYMFLPDKSTEAAWPPLASENLVTHAPHENRKMKMASLTPGTCSKWLWLLPSGPDQIHHHAMRGDPPDGILPQRTIYACSVVNAVSSWIPETQKPPAGANWQGV